MKNAPRQAGFSLIEVMLAVLIMGIALVGLTHGMTTALESTKDSAQQTSVVMLAAGQMETLRAEGFLSDGTTEGDFGDDLPAYKWEQTVSPSTLDGLHKVVVVVKDAKSGGTLYTLETMLFDPDYPANAEESAAASKENQREHEKARKRDRRRG
ncbi:MAG: prepilin-type N-terminal cleavage/methylation domain-containing protein [Limisphaerales bacterium]